MAHIPPAYCYRCPFNGTYPTCDLACAGALEAEIRRQGPETVAAFIAEPVAGAALCAAVLRYLKAHDLVAASARMGAVLLEKLQSLRDLPAVGDVRGLGLMADIELVADKAGKQPYSRSHQIAERVQAAALARGVNVYLGSGMANDHDGDAILIGPPFVITPAQIDDLVAGVGGAIVEVTT